MTTITSDFPQLFVIYSITSLDWIEFATQYKCSSMLHECHNSFKAIV